MFRTNLSWNAWLHLLHQNSNVKILCNGIFGSKYKSTCVFHSPPILQIRVRSYSTILSCVEWVVGWNQQKVLLLHTTITVLLFSVIARKMLWFQLQKWPRIHGGYSTHACSQRFGDFCLNVIECLCFSLFYSTNN